CRPWAIENYFRSMLIIKIVCFFFYSVSRLIIIFYKNVKNKLSSEYNKTWLYQ
ncbi:hypothetical protein L9F63_001679, partial [Diploptera punctata]